MISRGYKAFRNLHCLFTSHDTAQYVSVVGIASKEDKSRESPTASHGDHVNTYKASDKHGVLPAERRPSIVAAMKVHQYEYYFTPMRPRWKTGPRLRNQTYASKMPVPEPPERSSWA